MSKEDGNWGWNEEDNIIKETWPKYLTAFLQTWIYIENGNYI